MWVLCQVVSVDGRLVLMVAVRTVEDLFLVTEDAVQHILLIETRGSVVDLISGATMDIALYEERFVATIQLVACPDCGGYHAPWGAPWTGGYLDQTLFL